MPKPPKQFPDDSTGIRPHFFKRMLRHTIPTWAEWHAMLPAIGMAILSALLLRLCYAPMRWSFVAWFALLPLFWGMRSCPLGRHFYPGFFFGTIMGLFGVYWFVVVARFNPLVWLGILPLAMYIGIYFGIISALMVWFARRMGPWGALLSGAAAWAGIEYFLGIGALGMPYGVGQSQIGWLSMAHVASLGGLPLVAAIVVAFNLSLMETIAAVRSGYGQLGAASRLGCVIAVVAAATIYGAGVMSARDARLESEPTVSITVALVQSNILQDDKYASYTEEDPKKREALQEQLNIVQLELLRSIERGAADLVVTPESTFTQDLMDVEENVQKEIFGGAIMRETMNIAREIDAPIIIGGIDNIYRTATGEWSEEVLKGIDSDNEYYGAEAYGGLWLVRPTDEAIRFVSDYRKVQLMPFGESVPYLGLIPGFAESIVQIGTFLRGSLGDPIGFFADQDDGTRAEVRIGPSICFEDQFAYIQNHFASEGANLFVNTTNDGWFDGSAGPRWHAEMARWRSIETGIPMVRCTNSGFTCVIDAHGRVVDEVPAMERVVHYADLRFLADPPRSIYTIVGPTFGVICLAWTIAGVLIYRRKKLAPPES